MQSRLRRIGTVVGLLALGWGGFAAAATTIEKVVAFPTDRQVRVQVGVKSDAAGPVELHGRITPMGGEGGVLWEGSLGTAKGDEPIEKVVGGLKPKLWTPGSPTLYQLTVTARQGGQEVAKQTIRTGFRSVEAREGQVLLNGKPIFLKGVAISPPGRDVPDEVAFSKEFAYAYVKSLRDHNLNLVRMNFTFEVDPRCQHWFDACDELGMLVYQGNYGIPPESQRGKMVDPEEQTSVFEGKGPEAARSSRPAPPSDFQASARAYKTVFETYARHPSVIIYILSNEQPGPNKSNSIWHPFLKKMSDEIHRWDPTRLIIGNAGYGWGREGDICDLHRYWGWYYNSFLTYYNLRDTVGMFGKETDKQPFTFSECVGSFTSPLGGFNAIFRKQLAPQLGWTGHSGEQSDDATAYQSFMVKHALESFRTMREQNHRMAGIMPFTILYYHYDVRNFDQMKPKPALEQMKISYAPVLTSVELWTPQVYAGRTIRPVVHVVNDAEDFSPLTGAKLTVTVTPRDGGAAKFTKSLDLPNIPYYQSRPIPVDIALPSDLRTGDYVLSAVVEKEGKAISQNQETLYVAEPLMRTMGSQEIAIYDPTGKTTKALASLGFVTNAVKDLSKAPTAKHLIIGQEAITKKAPLPALADLVRNGGRILLLGQNNETFDPSWLPAKVQMLEGTATDPTYTPKIRPTAAQSHVNPERPWHPVFRNVDRSRLKLWSDYTNWDQSKKGFPQVFPMAYGFKLIDDKDLGNVAILADYDRGLEGVAIAELFDGSGSVLFTGLDLVNRAGLDPIADRMLVNLVSYLLLPDHSDTQPLIDKPIVWGDYPTERGVLTGPLHGLVYNCRWVAPPTNPQQKPLPDNAGAWNTKPGTPFVPKGIRPFGPYTWSTGAAPREESSDANGTGVFHCRVPAGRKVVVTKVENTTKSPQALTVAVNGKSQASPPIAPGKTITLRTPIPGGATDLSVRYTGNKQLVVLETSFE